MYIAHQNALCTGTIDPFVGGGMYIAIRLHLHRDDCVLLRAKGQFFFGDEARYGLL
jgi:hypothetical protein